MYFEIDGIKSIGDSNDFIVNFCEKLKEVFGKCSWAYFPSKNGPKREITLGKIKINSYFYGEDTFLIFKVSYKQKGVIDKIGLERYIENNELEISNFDIDKMEVAKFDEETLKKIEGCISEALSKNVNEFVINYSIRSLAPMGEIQSNKFNLYPTSTKIGNYYISCFKVRGQALTELAFKKKVEKKLKYIIDVISMDINLPVLLYIDETNQKKSEVNNKNIFRENNYLEGVSLHEGFVIISEETLKLINYILSPDFPIDDIENLDKEIAQYLKGGAHFNRALVHDGHIEELYKHVKGKSLVPGLQLNNFIFNGVNVNNSSEQLVIYDTKELFNITQEYESEISLSFYLSAIEVVSDYKEEEEINCNECGQKKYGIKRRVINFIKNYLNDEIALAFSKTYDVRSKFLHAGKKNSTGNVIDRVIPQLSTSSLNGTTMHENGLNSNMIKEFTGFVFREHLKNIIPKIID